MSAPLDFLRILARELRESGIPFAITSGMACVHYGLQQTTKDSDWIIPDGSLARLREMFARLEGGMPPWRICYRPICGAPLEPEFMRHGWTSHLSIWDGAASVEHKVDMFSKPPRVKTDEIEVEAEGWIARHLVAQMKRTDREKDWPMVRGLGHQLWERGDARCLLHLARPEALLAAWHDLPRTACEAMAVRRPLLRVLDRTPPPTRLDLERLVALERLVWERVNQHRHRRYSSAWKSFHRQWRQEEEWAWPVNEPFDLQHRRLLQAACRHGLPPNPLADVRPQDLVQAAVHEAARVGAATETEMAQVLPPTDELLP